MIRAAFLDTVSHTIVTEAREPDGQGLRAIDRAYTQLLALFQGPVPRWIHLVVERIR
jgi:hypothetical protein